MIGIGISTCNRKAVAEQSVNAWKQYLPSGAKLVIVDDASEFTFPGATFSFAERAGLSVVKNKCLQLLEDCTDIFIIDDDVCPIKPEWWEIYTKSGLNHACYTFNRTARHVSEDYIEYKEPNGCLLYFKKICLETIGGWDTDFKGYGFEHLNVSDRIFNAGLTPARYIDARRALTAFAMIETASTFTSSERRATIPLNKKLYLANYNSKEFKPYK